MTPATIGESPKAGQETTEPARTSVFDTPCIEPMRVYLTAEAAEVVRMKPSTIREAVRLGRIRGQGKPFRILGKELLKLV